MPEVVRKSSPSLSSQQEATPVFAEEVRLPLSNAARDAFLRAMEEDRERTPAALAAAERYRQAKLSGQLVERLDEPEATE